MNSVTTLVRNLTGRGKRHDVPAPVSAPVAPLVAPPMAKSDPVVWNRRSILAGYVVRTRRTFGWRRRLAFILLTVLTFFYAAFLLLFPRQLLPVTVMPVVVIWCLVVWALPARETHPNRTMAWLFMAYSATLALWPNYLALQISGLPWITTARLLCAPLALLLLFHGSTSAPFRREMLERLRSAKWIVRGIVVFAVLQVISIAFSSMPFATFNKVINNQITWTAIFFSSIWFFSDEARFRKWIYMMSVAMMIVAGIAILEARNEGVLWANSIPFFLQVDDSMVEGILGGSTRYYGGYRVVGTSTTPLSLAELAAGAAPLGLYFLFRFNKPAGIALFIVFVAAMINTVVSTDSRMGIVAMLFGVMCFAAWAAIMFIRQNRNSILAPILATGTPAFLSLVLAATFFVGRIRNVVWGHSGQTASTNARYDQISLGLEKIWQSPVFGFGASQGGGKLGWISPGGKLSIDTYYLSVLLDYGFVGFVVFYFVFLAAVYKVWSIAFSRFDEIGRLAAIWGSILVIYLTTKAVLSQELNHPLIFIAFGAVVSLCWMDKTRPNPSTLNKPLAYTRN